MGRFDSTSPQGFAETLSNCTKEDWIMYRLLTLSALAAVLAVSPALAQQSGEQPQGAPPLLEQQETAPQGSDTILEKQPQDQAPQDQAAEQQPMGSQEVQFVTAQESSDWLASSLRGRTVYNTENQALGDISDVVLDENGEVIAVLIGVGGFLGIGGKDVGVNFAALQFEERKVEAPPPSAGQATGPMGSTTLPAAAEDDADHSNMIIVLNVTEEQLKAAPAYMRIGEETEPEPETSNPAAQSPEPAPSQAQ
jgi:sporulation protein YlmC with PRC-barrel domain